MKFGKNLIQPVPQTHRFVLSNEIWVSSKGGIGDHGIEGTEVGVYHIFNMGQIDLIFSISNNF